MTCSSTLARELDERDWDGYAANHAPDGVLAFRDGVAHEGLAEFVSNGAGRYAATQHVSTDHSVARTPTRATVRRLGSVPHRTAPHEAGLADYPRSTGDCPHHRGRAATATRLNASDRAATGDLAVRPRWQRLRSLIATVTRR
jgi:hypothetical protein